MPAKATYEMVVLFEDEIRVAARCVREFRDLPKDATDEEHQRASTNLLRSCITALDGADKEGSVLLLGRKPHATKRGRK